MTKVAKIRAWKEKWGYDDFSVMPGGRPMKAFSPDRAGLDALLSTLTKGSGGDAEDESESVQRLRRQIENPAARRLAQLATQLEKLPAKVGDGASGPTSGSTPDKTDQAEKTEKITPSPHADLVRRLRAEAARIRLTDESPPAPLVKEAADALRASDEAHASSLDEWQDDLLNPYDPARGPLATSVADRIRNRNILDRSAAIDQVTGNIYSTDRRQELRDLTGDHYLAKAFGLRAIREEARNGQVRAGILFDHEASSTYQRDALNKDVDKSMVALYKNFIGTPEGLRLALPAFNAKQVFFVNNANVAAKLSKAYTDQWVDPQDPARSYRPQYSQTVEIKPGVYALVMNAVVDDGFKGRLLEGSGCTPSAYQVEKVKATGPARDPLTDPSMRDARLPSNEAKLTGVANSAGCKRLAQLPDGAPIKQAALAASKMVTGLEDALSKLKTTPRWDAVKDNKLVASALEKIERLMETMPTYTEDVPRFSRLFDLLVDEVYLVLATCKPYGKDDHQRAATAMIDERMPTLATLGNGVTHSTALLSSGMDGMSTAVAAAFTLTGSKKLHLIDAASSHSANYFEVEANLVGDTVKGDASLPLPTGRGAPPYTPPVIMGTLNPSTPVKGANPRGDGATESWTVVKLITQINAVLNVHMARLTADKPAVAIIDVTVERNATGTDQEMDKLVADPTIKQALKDGKLQLMLAKSYQKYPSLGAGKAMAGGLTVIGKNIAADKEPLKTVVDAEKAEALLADPGRPGALAQGHDESQIVTHFMTHERDAERTMMERAAKNAKFVRGFLPPDGPGMSKSMRYDEGLPFLVFEKKGGVKVPNGGRVRELNISVLLQQQGLEERMSFGFQNSSCLAVGQTGDQMRIGLGQESEEDLVEKLYATTRLAAAPPAAVRPVGRPGGRPEIPSHPASDIVGMAGEAANKAMVKVKAALAKRTDGDAAWRERMVQALVAAKVLDTKDITRVNGAITVPIDTELSRHLALITDDASTTDPEPLAKKLALVGALRQPRNTDPLLAASLQAIPMADGDRAAWIKKAEEALGTHKITLPTRAADKDPGDALYMRALSKALKAVKPEEPAGDSLVKVRSETPPKASIQAMAELAGQAELSLQAAETGGGRVAWIKNAEEALKARGVKLPIRSGAEGGEQQYVEALRGELHGADDADRLHAHSAKGWSGPGTGDMGFEASYLPNIVASCANFISAATMDAPAEFKALADMVIEHGLQDLSPEGRERLLTRRIQASLARPADMDEAEIAKLGQAAKAMPYREGPAHLMMGPGLIETLKPGPSVPNDLKLDKLLKALSSPLDISTQCDLFGRMVELAMARAGKEPEDAEGKAARKRIARRYKAQLDTQLDALALTYALPPELPKKEAEALLLKLKKEAARREYKGAIEKAKALPSPEQREAAIQADKMRIAEDLVKHDIDALRQKFPPPEAIEAAVKKLIQDAAEELVKAAALPDSEPTVRPELPSPARQPMEARDIRRGAKGVDTHGPQPMPKASLDALKIKVRDAGARLA